MGAYWTVNGTETDGLQGPQNGLSPGQTPDYPFLFRKRPDWDDPDDDHVARFEAVRPAPKSIDTFDSYETIGGEWHWREQTGQSPLVRIEPPDDDQTSRAVWGLIQGVDDATVLSKKRCSLTLSILVISVGDEFTTESDIRTARQRTGP